MLEVARLLGENLDVTVSPTFPDALPLEFNDKPDAYIDLIIDEMLPAVAEQGLADAVDVFCETIRFTAPQTEQIFRAAKSHGLPVKAWRTAQWPEGGRSYRRLWSTQCRSSRICAAGRH